MFGFIAFILSRHRLWSGRLSLRNQRHWIPRNDGLLSLLIRKCRVDVGDGVEWRD